MYVWHVSSTCADRVIKKRTVQVLTSLASLGAELNA